MKSEEPLPYAIQMRATGGPEVLEVCPLEIGDPGIGEVRIRHLAIGLNFIDTYHRSGLYAVPLPSRIGNEAAGVIEVTGEMVTGFQPGDHVGYFTGPLGAYASHRNVHQGRLVRLPEGISPELAAASMLKGCTAEYLVERCARVSAGQTILVHAAAGGVGSILVQWLKAIGATVIAHSGDAKKAAIAAELGADHSLDCRMDELASRVRALTDGRGVSSVLDGVGAASWAASIEAAARRGLLVSFGNASGPVPAISVLDLMKAGSVFVTRPTLADYCSTPDEMRASAHRLFELIATAAIQVNIGARFPLSQCADAHRAIEARATTGSTILIP